MSKVTCKVCGATSDEKTLHHESFSKYLDGYHCWTCYHKQAVAQNISGFSCGIVGNNSGWIENFTFAGAIDFALDEIEYKQNIDMGIKVGSALDTGYYSCAIVRNHQLYIKVADLHHLEDMEHDERIAVIEKILQQLSFELLESE